MCKVSVFMYEYMYMYCTYVYLEKHIHVYICTYIPACTNVHTYPKKHIASVPPPLADSNPDQAQLGEARCGQASSCLLNLAWNFGRNPYIVVISDRRLSQARWKRPDEGTAGSRSLAYGRKGSHFFGDI